ncbi:MAG: GFA family protein [Pseudomonadales bacterium]
MTIIGSCLCGAVRFEAAVPPRRVTHCHCSMCRKALGAAVATFATFESSKVRWIGDPARYDSSDRAWRGFCVNCGSSVCFGYKPRPERIYVTLGIFDDPNAFPAGFHDYRNEKLEWLCIDEELPDAQRPT